MKTIVNAKGTLVLNSAAFLPAKGEKKPATVLVDVLCEMNGSRQWHLLMVDPKTWNSMFARNERIPGGLTEGDTVTVAGTLLIPEKGEDHYCRAEPKHGTFVAYDKGRFVDWKPVGLEKGNDAFPMPPVKPWDQLPIAQKKKED